MKQRSATPESVRGHRAPRLLIPNRSSDNELDFAVLIGNTHLKHVSCHVLRSCSNRLTEKIILSDIA